MRPSFDRGLIFYFLFFYYIKKRRERIGSAWLSVVLLLESIRRKKSRARVDSLFRKVSTPPPPGRRVSLLSRVTRLHATRHGNGWETFSSHRLPSWNTPRRCTTDRTRSRYSSCRVVGCFRQCFVQTYFFNVRGGVQQSLQG